MDKLKLVSLNARGLRNAEKRKTLFRYLIDKNVHIALLQETFCTDDFIQTFNNDWNGSVIHSCSRSLHGRGVCIMISNDVNYEVISSYTDDDGRMVLLNIDIDGNIYSIVSLYAPNVTNDRRTFLDNIVRWCSENALASDDLICGGDYNSVFGKLDRKNDNICTRSAGYLRSFGRRLKLRDVWRDSYPCDRQYTYIDPSSRGRDSRIDYILVSESLSKFVLNCDIRNAPVPDHNAVFIDININDNPRGPGYWKLNTGVLDNEDYVKGIYELIDKTVNDYLEVGYKLVWELCRIRIKEFSIRFCKNENRIHKSRILVLEDRLKNNVYKDEYEKQSILNELDMLYRSRSRGAQIRSRAQYIEDGEKSTSFFLGLENSRQKKNVLKVIKQKGETHTSSEALLNAAAADFYDELYKSCKPKSNDISHYLQNLTNLKRLTDIERDSIEGKITLAEASNAIKCLKPNKSPGLDGIPAEFYVKFWDKIGNIIVNSFNESYDDGILSESQRQAVISLIFKKGDAELLHNYRPISLTNSDYKILAFCLANRLQIVIKNIIHPGQVAYIKGRFIGTNVRLVHDIMEFYEKTERGGILFALDFQKAYDSLEWEFLFQALREFNFGEMFISWIKTLYSHPVSFVKNNGYLSRPIDIQRSVRQGCPVSCLLFIIAVEIMGHKIRNDKKLKGVTIPNCHINLKMLQYADDGIAFLNTIEELETLIDIVTEFGNLSGTKLNLTKCEGLWHGAFKDNQKNCDILNIRWPEEPIRCLGIYISNDVELNDSLNWTKKLDKMRLLINSWKKRDLTIFGKVCVLKQLVMPQILYSASLLYIPDYVTKEVNTIFYDFIWGKKEYVKRNTLISDVANGGINMIDIESMFQAVKCSWAVRLFNADEYEIWPTIARNVYNLHRDDFLIFKLNFTNCKTASFIRGIPLFYQQVLLAFNKAKCMTYEHFHDNIFDQPIWGNDFVNCDTESGKNMTLFLQEWVNDGVIRIGNLRFIDGILDENFVYQKIRKKTNILAEVTRIKKALRPYSHLIGDHEPENEASLPLFMHPDCW